MKLTLKLKRESLLNCQNKNSKICVFTIKYFVWSEIQARPLMSITSIIICKIVLFRQMWQKKLVFDVRILKVAADKLLFY